MNRGRAYAYRNLKEYQKAIDDLSKVSELNPALIKPTPWKLTITIFLVTTITVTLLIIIYKITKIPKTTLLVTVSFSQWRYGYLIIKA